jgi:hypothetical protein
MEKSFIFEKFEDYLSSQYIQINEAEVTSTGFVGILGATDAQNLGESVAAKLGIKTNMIYTITINGVKDMVTLGKAKIYQGFPGIKESGASKSKEDYFFAKSGETTQEIKAAVGAKGNAIIGFNQESAMEVKASNNGLLAFMRACTAMAYISGPDGFSKNPWNGKMIINIGNPVANEASRQAGYLAVNIDVNGSSDTRYTRIDYKSAIDASNNKGSILKYINESKSFSAGYLVKDLLTEAEEKQKTPAEMQKEIKVIGDTIADAIRASYWTYSRKGSGGVNKFSAYKPYFEAFSLYIKTIGKEDWKNLKPENRVAGLSAYVLATILQPIFKQIGQTYPMNYKVVDIFPQCKQILAALGKGQDQKYLGKAMGILKGMLDIYKPTKYAKIPAFDPVLGEFWDAISSAIITRAAITFSANVNKPGFGEEEGGPGEGGGGEQSEIKKNKSGEV